MTKGSLKLRLAAIVRTGSKQQNKAPKRIIFPICGSTGNRAKWTPSGVSSSCLSKAFCQKKGKEKKNQPGQGGKKSKHSIRNGEDFLEIATSLSREQQKA